MRLLGSSMELLHFGEMGSLLLPQLEGDSLQFVGQDRLNVLSYCQGLEMASLL